jgi:dCTP deaminase
VATIGNVIGLAPMPDWAIQEMCKEFNTDIMIWPYINEQVRERDGERVISYGVGPCGYDIRLGTQFERIRGSGIADPKKFSVLMEGFNSFGPVTLSSGDYVLGISYEHIQIPDNVLAVVIGKSTYARCGLFVNTTPLEPGWRGYITLELSNLSPSPLVVYPNEGIAQIIFFLLPTAAQPKQTYDGGYQDAANVPQPPLVQGVKD